VTDIPLEQS